MIAAVGLLLRAPFAPPTNRVNLMLWRGSNNAGPILLAAGAAGLIVTGAGWLLLGAGSCR